MMMVKDNQHHLLLVSDHLLKGVSDHFHRDKLKLHLQKISTRPTFHRNSHHQDQDLFSQPSLVNPLEDACVCEPRTNCYVLSKTELMMVIALL